MILHYKFDTLYDKEIRVNCEYDHEINDSLIDKTKYLTDDNYKKMIDDKYYDEALECCAYAIVSDEVY